MKCTRKLLESVPMNAHITKEFTENSMSFAVEVNGKRYRIQVKKFPSPILLDKIKIKVIIIIIPL